MKQLLSSRGVISLGAITALTVVAGLMGSPAKADTSTSISPDLNSLFFSWDPAKADDTSTAVLDSDVTLKSAFSKDSTSRYSTSALFANKISINNVDHTYSFTNGDAQSSSYYTVDANNGSITTLSGQSKYYSKKNADGNLDLGRVTTTSDGMQIAEKLTLNVANRSIDHETTIRNGSSTLKGSAYYGTLLDTMLDSNDQIPIYSAGDGGIYLEDSNLRLYCEPTSSNLSLNAGHYVHTPGGAMANSVSADNQPMGKELTKVGDSAITYQLKNATTLPVDGTVTYDYSEMLYTQNQLTWKNGEANGWKMFSGTDLTLMEDPGNALFRNYVFYSPNHEAISKQFRDLIPGVYHLTVYAKGEAGSDPTLPLKVSLKTNPSSGESRTLLLANPLNSGEKVQKGYFKVSVNVTLSPDEDNPLIVVENYNGGYIAGVSITPIN
ncbi:hypothetical protein [Lactococcus lactis]|uniref:hypothetical protein n=1 Tax=Lactococcus lactis TaxID=1358 RepID=UPI00111CE1AD|nr:hypothetical protein [Lactococcus lactis]TNU77550.1 hypothetical protein FIB48_11405 [Lactococcus lactis subsp. lactis]